MSHLQSTIARGFCDRKLSSGMQPNSLHAYAYACACVSTAPTAKLSFSKTLQEANELQSHLQRLGLLSMRKIRINR